MSLAYKNPGPFTDTPTRFHLGARRNGFALSEPILAWPCKRQLGW